MKAGKGNPPQVADQAFLIGMEGVMEVMLIRHGQQQAGQDARDRLNDSPLSDHGRAQARLLGEALSTDRLDAIYTSPLRRALETAEAVSHHHELEPRVIEDLREIEIFRDIPADQAPQEYLGEELWRAVQQRMVNEKSWDVYPYSEPSFSFRKRAINAVEAAIAASDGERIAVVCHGGVINAYIGHTISSPYDRVFRPAHASIHVVAARKGRRALRRLNDVHHLTLAGPEMETY